MYNTKPPAGTQINWGKPITQGLVGCWLFNEGSGLRVNDLSKNNNDGILTRFEPFTSTSGWSGGPHGRSIMFDISAYINVGNNPSLNFTTEMTASAWVTGAVQAETSPIMAKNDITNISSWSMRTGATSTNKLDVRISKDGISLYKNYESSIIAFDNMLHHIAFTFDNGILSLFVDGVLDLTPNKITDSATTNIFASTQITSIAADFITGSLNTQYTGIIHECYLWNRALSPQEIQYHYIQPFAMFK